MGYCQFSSSGCDTAGLFHDRQGTGARQGVTGPGLHAGARARHNAAALRYGATALDMTWPACSGEWSSHSGVATRRSKRATQRPTRNDTAPSAWRARDQCVVRMQPGPWVCAL